MSRAKSVPALDPGRGLFRTKSPVSVSAQSTARVRSPSPQKIRTSPQVPERFKSPEPQLKTVARFKSPERLQDPPSPEPGSDSQQGLNGTFCKSLVNGSTNGNGFPASTCSSSMDNVDDPGVSHKKGVKVVHRVVRKVLPTEEQEETGPTHKLPNASAGAPSLKAHAMSGFSFKHDIIKTDSRDDFTRGLTNMMVRGRTREPRPRGHKDERAEKVEPEKKDENDRNVELEEKKEQKEIKPSQLSQDMNQSPTNSGVVLKEVTSVAVPKASSRFTRPLPQSLSPALGFVPVPKPAPFTPRPVVRTALTRSPTTPPSQKPSSGFTPDPIPPSPAVGTSSGPVSPSPGLLVQPADVSQNKVESVLNLSLVDLLCSRLPAED